MSPVAHLKKAVLYALLSAGFAGCMVVAVAMPASAQPKTGLCYDGLAGAATVCPDGQSTRYPIDGKRPASFDKSKCYKIIDPEKGWFSTNVNCGDAVFKDVINTVKPSDVTDNAESGNCPTELDPQGRCDIVEQYLNPAINALSVLAVLFIVGAIIVGGIQYSASADQPQAAAAARGRIINAIVTLLCFMFLWAFLQWVIPGGLL